MRPPRQPNRPSPIGENKPRSQGGELPAPRFAPEAEAATAALSPNEAKKIADPRNYPRATPVRRAPGKSEATRGESAAASPGKSREKPVAKDALGKVKGLGGLLKKPRKKRANGGQECQSQPGQSHSEIAQPNKAHKSTKERVVAPQPEADASSSEVIANPPKNSAVSAYESARQKMSVQVANVRTPKKDEISARRQERIAEQRRLWSRRAIALGGGAFGVLLIAWAILFSPLLGIDEKKITISGIGPDAPISQSEVAQAVKPVAGTSIVTVNTGQLADQIEEKVSLIHTATVTKKWPKGLAISVTLRTPVACLLENDTCVAVDGEGVHVKINQEVADALPKMTTAPGTQLSEKTITTMLNVSSALDLETRGRVASIEVDEHLRAKLILTDGPTVIWGDDADNELKASVLKPLLTQAASYYDVSAPTAPVTG